MRIMDYHRLTSGMQIGNTSSSKLAAIVSTNSEAKRSNVLRSYFYPSRTHTSTHLFYKGTSNPLSKTPTAKDQSRHSKCTQNVQSRFDLGS